MPEALVALTSSSKKNATRSDSSQQPFLFQEHLNAMGTSRNPGRTPYINPSTGESYVYSWDWSVCRHFDLCVPAREGLAPDSG